METDTNPEVFAYGTTTERCYQNRSENVKISKQHKQTTEFRECHPKLNIQVLALYKDELI
jgi:hypothetical protein